jgi:gluconokinase
MVVVIMGVSGSGKTVVGEALARQLNWRFEDADHWHSASNIEKMQHDVALTDQDREPWLRRLNGAIRRWIANKCDVVLACSALRKSYRDALRDGLPDHELVRFVYLKGTPDLIDQRLKSRVGHFMPELLLTSQFAALEEPDAPEALLVEISNPITTEVDSIITSLQLASRKHLNRTENCPDIHDPDTNENENENDI